MIFSEEDVAKILTGEKTVIRLPVKSNRTGKYLPCQLRVEGGSKGTYALQLGPKKGARPRAKTLLGFRLRVKSIQLQSLGDVTDRQARLEGFKDRTVFLFNWLRAYGLFGFQHPIWRVEFELVEEQRLPIPL